MPKASDMKYSIREDPDGGFTLLRYGEEVKHLNSSRPNNAELEFWLRLTEICELLDDLDWCIGYDLGPERNHVALDKAQTLARQTLGRAP